MLGTEDDAGTVEAVPQLCAGQIVALPTDTVYGIARRLDRPDALDRSFLLKGRPATKAIPVLLGDCRGRRHCPATPRASAVLAGDVLAGSTDTGRTGSSPGLPPR